MKKEVIQITIMLILCMCFGKGYTQTKKNRIGVNFLYYPGLNYERMVAEKKSMSFSINKHDWGYAHGYDDIKVVKGQAELRFYKFEHFGSYWSVNLTYRYRDDPSIVKGSEFAASFFPGGDPPDKYAIKLHSMGFAVARGYRSKLIFKRFCLDGSLRLGLYLVNSYAQFKRVLRDETWQIVLSNNVTAGDKKRISQKIAGELVLSGRISYLF